jgi:hypothetical protein
MADGTDKKSKTTTPKSAKSTAAAPAKAAAKKAPAKAAPSEPQTKFAQFLVAKKVDPRRIIAASRELESLRPEDRIIKLKKRLGRKAEGDAAATKETRKPRSGRPVTPRALDAAMKGGKMSGPTKTRLLHAINRILVQKKQEAVELRTLF